MTNKTILTSIVLLYLTFSASSQNPEKITIGFRENIYSKILNEERELWIYCPGPKASYAKNKEKYPVLYLLDAEDHFYSTVGMIKQMSGRWPRIIVVGIVNTDRERDLKPSISNDKGYNKDSGGGAKFMNFIEEELIPHIDSIYPTAPYRVFSGHSLGGLTVINTLLNNTSLFNAYIAIDPSLWWNNQSLNEQAKKDFATKDYNNRTLFVGRANNMPPGMDTLAALNDTSQYTMLYRSVTRFLKILRTSKHDGLRWTTSFYPDETHGTVELIGEYDALKFLFDFYQFRTSIFELNPNMNIDSALIAHFQNISKRFGYKVLPSESLVNNLGYTCMTIRKWDKAERFFKLNIENFPEDANVYDSMGDFYQATGNIQKAIDNYEKALTLGNDPGTRKKLELLKSRK